MSSEELAINTQDKLSSGISAPALMKSKESIGSTESRVIIIYEINSANTDNVTEKPSEESSQIPKFSNRCYVKYTFPPRGCNSKIPIAEWHKKRPAKPKNAKKSGKMPQKLKTKSDLKPKMMLTKDGLFTEGNYS